jgi:hypothetical protein
MINIGFLIMGFGLGVLITSLFRNKSKGTSGLTFKEVEKAAADVFDKKRNKGYPENLFYEDDDK